MCLWVFMWLSDCVVVCSRLTCLKTGSDTREWWTSDNICAMEIPNTRNCFTKVAEVDKEEDAVGSERVLILCLVWGMKKLGVGMRRRAPHSNAVFRAILQGLST